MVSSGLLTDVLAQLGALPPEKQKELADTVIVATKEMRWVPNSGPQLLAFNSKADQLAYGGEVGGGKTDLIIGAAIERHQRALLLRRQTKEVPFLVERTQALLGTRQGYNGSDKRWRVTPKQVIQFGGCRDIGDEGAYKGERKDLIGLDEATEFAESQVDFLVGWLGSADPKQHCQLIMATNPPGSAEGAWFIRWFAPWLDPTHPRYKTRDGTLLWCMPVADTHPAQFEWSDEPFEKTINGRIVKALSRTFIRSGLSDNPDYAQSDYGARLGNMPEVLRRRYLEGDFTAGMTDHERQVIPTAWIVAAQERWRQDGGKAEPMSAMALDPAGGGEDHAALAVRHGGWYGELETQKGEETADGSAMAGWIARRRRHACPVVVDCGGGYGGAVTLRLKDNQVPFVAYNGAHSSMRKTKDGTLRFANKRSEVWWKFMEELDPDQEGGSVVALPPDAELLGDLAAPRYEISARGIQVESKVVFGEGGKVIGGIRKRLGRSPNKGDAVVMAMSEGNRAIQRMLARADFNPDEQGRALDISRGRRPVVVMGHMAARRVR